MNKKSRNSFSADTLSVRNVKKKLFTQDKKILKRNYELRKTVMLKFDRKHQYSGKQSSFNEKLIEKIKEDKLK